MDLTQAVLSYNHAATKLNRIADEFYNILLPWQGKKVVKKDGTPTKEFNQVFSGLTQFNCRYEFLHINAYCSHHGVRLNVSSYLRGGYSSQNYKAGIVENGVLTRVDTFEELPTYDLSEMIELQKQLHEAEQVYLKAKDKMGIFQHYC